MIAPNDPLLVGGGGVLIAMVGYLARRQIAAQEERTKRLEARVGALENQMAAHDGSKLLLEQMYKDLQELTKLTNRIAGHLNIM